MSAFALVHGLHDVQLIAGVVGVFLVDQRLGNHADHTTAGFGRRLRHHAHQAAAAAAIDQLPAMLADPCPHSMCCVGEQWVSPGREPQ